MSRVYLDGGLFHDTPFYKVSPKSNKASWALSYLAIKLALAGVAVAGFMGFVLTVTK